MRKDRKDRKDRKEPQKASALAAAVAAKARSHTPGTTVEFHFEGEEGEKMVELFIQLTETSNNPLARDTLAALQTMSIPPRQLFFIFKRFYMFEKNASIKWDHTSKNFSITVKSKTEFENDLSLLEMLLATVKENLTAGIQPPRGAASASGPLPRQASASASPPEKNVSSRSVESHNPSAPSAAAASARSYVVRFDFTEKQCDEMYEHLKKASYEGPKLKGILDKSKRDGLPKPQILQQAFIQYYDFRDAKLLPHPEDSSGFSIEIGSDQAWTRALENTIATFQRLLSLIKDSSDTTPAAPPVPPPPSSLLSQQPRREMLLPPPSSRSTSQAATPMAARAEAPPPQAPARQAPEMRPTAPRDLSASTPPLGRTFVSSPEPERAGHHPSPVASRSAAAYDLAASTPQPARREEVSPPAVAEPRPEMSSSARQWGVVPAPTPQPPREPAPTPPPARAPSPERQPSVGLFQTAVRDAEPVGSRRPPEYALPPAPAPHIAQQSPEPAASPLTQTRREDSLTILDIAAEPVGHYVWLYLRKLAKEKNWPPLRHVWFYPRESPQRRDYPPVQDDFTLSSKLALTMALRATMLPIEPFLAINLRKWFLFKNPVVAEPGSRQIIINAEGETDIPQFEKNINFLKNLFELATTEHARRHPHLSGVHFFLAMSLTGESGVGPSANAQKKADEELECLAKKYLQESRNADPSLKNTRMLSPPSLRLF